MLVILPKRHGAVAAQPGGELFVGADESITADGKHDGAQFVEHFIGALRPGGDFGVEPDEGLAQVGFNEHVTDPARQAERRDVMPARRLVPAPQREVRRGWLLALPPCHRRRGDTRQQVNKVVFDGVLFVEHGITPYCAKNLLKRLFFRFLLDSICATNASVVFFQLSKIFIISSCSLTGGTTTSTSRN